MTSIQTESKTAESASRCEKMMGRAKTAVSDAIEDGAIAAKRFLRQKRNAAEDAVEQRVLAIRHNPVRSVAVAFSAGMVAGSVLSCFRGKAAKS